MATRRKTTPQEIDDIQDRMGSIRELDFDERRQARKAQIGDERPEAEVEAEFPRGGYARRATPAGSRTRTTVTRITSAWTIWRRRP